MRKILLMVGAMLTLTAGMALATGGSVSLNWAKCRADAGAGSNTNPACAANTGQRLLVTSYMPPVEVSQGLEGLEVIVDFQTQNGVANNCWWNMVPSSAMRSAALVINPHDPGDANGNPIWGCGSYFLLKGGSGGGGMALLGNGNGRIACAVGIPAGSGTNPGTSENSGVGITIKNDNTTSCTGCNVPVCLTMNRMTFAMKGGARFDVFLATPLPRGNTHAYSTGGFTGCEAATPARRATWGSVKALYR